MKIDRNDLQVFKENALELFQQGIKAKVTKDKYTRVLRKILTDVLENVLEGSFEERASELVNHTKKDPDWGMSVLLAFSLTKGKDTGLRFSPVLQFGRISGFMAHDSDPSPYGYQSDIIGTEGSSGSPILNKDGKVIGLAQSVLYSYFESDDKMLKGKAKLGLVWGTSNHILSIVAKAAKNYFDTGTNDPIPIPYTEYTLRNVPLSINKLS